MKTPNQTEERAQGQHEELNEAEMKSINGGSGLLSGGNDLSGILQGTITISNSSSGTNSDGQSYSSTDSHTVDLGLGSMLNNTNF